MENELLSTFVMALSLRLQPDHTRREKPLDWVVTTTAKEKGTAATRDERRGVSRVIQGDGGGGGG